MQIQFIVSKIWKVIDIFTGKPIQNAKVHILNTKIKGLEKGNGFYVFYNLIPNTYEMIISAEGYDTKTVLFEVKEEALDEPSLISLIPRGVEGIQKLYGYLECNGELAKNTVFYYSLCCQEYQKRISTNVQTGNDTIRLQVYDDISLEGRKFAVEDVPGIYTLGRYDYVEKKYKMKEQTKEEMEMGFFAYLLFEEETDETGQFEILFPRYLIQTEEAEILFFLGNHMISKKVTKDDTEIGTIQC